MSKKIISIEDLVFSYPAPAREPAIKGLSLAIDEGDFVVILGHNGSGKSTLARLLNALLLPTSGKVYVDGMDTSDPALTLDIRRTVGMVFQNPDNQIVNNVVEDDVAFAPENLGVPSAEIRERVDEALKTVGMYDYRLHAPHLLSGGQKQRVAIAGVLAMRPRLLVLDEATAMLDPIGRTEVINTIRSLNAELGVTVLLITHHMNEAIFADRLIVMSEGGVILDGSPKEVFMNIDLLRSVGLDVPDTSRLLRELSIEGMNLPLNALSIEECADAVSTALRQG